MPSLPESDIYLLVRTYFGDDAGWDALKALIEEGSEEGFFANVQYVDDRQFDGFSSKALEDAHPHRDSGWDVMYVADEQAITRPVHPLLLVRMGNTAELPFRCRADALYEIDANLSLANLDWDDFRDQVDASGVYGGVEAAQPPTDPATNPLVAAHRSGSDKLITITVPPDIWWEMHEDLFEAPIDSQSASTTTSSKATLSCPGCSQKTTSWSPCRRKTGPSSESARDTPCRGFETRMTRSAASAASSVIKSPNYSRATFRKSKPAASPLNDAPATRRS
jgi:hypothetical protein